MNLSRANRRIAIIVMVGALLVVGGATGIISPVRWLFDHTVLPAGRGLAAAGNATGTTIHSLAHVQDLAKNNDALARENASLRQRLAADSETARDNVDLRRELGLQVAGAPHEVAAEVLAFNPNSYRQFVIISKGSRDGLAAGMAVLSQGVVAGLIDSTTATTAKVRLTSDPEFKLTAKDESTGATGLVQGQLGAGLLMSEIGQSDVVHPGDTVTTTGYGGTVPPGLLIGKIESTTTVTNAVFQSAQVSTSFSTSGLRFVFVVAGS